MEKLTRQTKRAIFLKIQQILIWNQKEKLIKF